MEENSVVDKMNEILLSNPDITYFGIMNMWNVEYDEKRNKIFQAKEEVLLCLEWLEGVEKNKKINRKIGNSYTLKHHVEEEYANKRIYIANGSFILAAIIAGFDVEKIPDYPNVYFNMSKESLRKKYPHTKEMAL